MSAEYVIDGIFLTRRLTGVERYSINLIKELDKIVEPGVCELLVPLCCDKSLDLKNIKEIRYGRIKGYLWEQTDLAFYLRKHKANVISLCNTIPFFAPRGIVALHDISLKVNPHFFNTSLRGVYSVMVFQIMYLAIIWSKAHIITVSEFSKSEILRAYRINPDRISLVSNGWQHILEIEPDEAVIDRLAIKNGGYFFAMATAAPNKNVKWIIEAARQHPEETFVLAGHMSLSAGGEDKPANLILAGYVSDGEAKALMAHCKAFILPTFYEGFGIPPMEALASGAKGIIVSDTPCMREIYGDIADYIDPYDYDHTSVDLRPRSREEIEAFLDNYSWEKAAKALLELL